ncbi:MAG: glycoside hydrolase family 31 protein [Bacteroidetes bacterium]|nr:glycoside hydrolase family 31 protein [Bacteroidota bacterium]MCL2302060.1 glycoside hydrolase family 31 protein [Lentimicrobiaceae bacterium]
MYRILTLIIFISILSFETQAQKNQVIIGNARFTLITPELVRLEYAENAAFVDEKTLFAQHRDTDFRDFTVEEKPDNRYVITTSRMRIEYHNDGFPFGQMNLRVYYNFGEEEQHWHIGSMMGNNLGGTLVTLDRIIKAVPTMDGLLSRDGWYVIHDTNKELLDKDGWIKPRHKEHIQDLYLFIYGTDYKAALSSLKAVSGPAPMPRKIVHGSWYCRWWDYTEDEYRQIVQEYKDHDFPLDILVFDMGWHTQTDATTGTGSSNNRGWTGYTWNRELIPNPEGLISDLLKENIYVVLNEHPHDGIRAHEVMYPEFMKAMGVDTAGRKEILFDAGNKKYMDNFMKYAHKESDDMGVSFWWLDWQQDFIYPVVRGTNMKHLPWLNHIYYNYSTQNNMRGAGFSRWGGWGSHRYPIQFSGDAYANWDMLEFEVDLTATSGNVGCFFWAHDIGGFYGGTDPELYTRWTQFGLLNSSLRIHSTKRPELDRRMWLYGEEATNAMRDVYHLRAQFMPYIYSSVWQCYDQMVPLNRAMYIDYPEAQESYENPQQFMFGDLILGAPITSAGEGPNKIASQKVWFPKGDTWYNFFTGQKYEGGTTTEEKCGLFTFPLYIKGGYPFPMQPYTPRMATTPLTELMVRCYPGEIGANNTYTLYEDDGFTRDYQIGKQAFTKMEYQKDAKNTTITVHPVEGSYDGQVKKRSYTFQLPEIKEPINPTVNGRKAKATRDESINGYIVEVPARSISEKVVLRW